MLKIPDINPQTSSKQESKQSTPQSAGTLQKATVPQKDQTVNPPPLVQQMFDVCIYMPYASLCIVQQFYIKICIYMSVCLARSTDRTEKGEGKSSLV